MDDRRARHLSKLLSLILRHRPGDFGIHLDEEGWADVESILAAVSSRGTPLSRADLEEVVRSSDKQRFALSDDGARIRAHQGHSVSVLLGYPEAIPPERLFHGTVARFLPGIRREGLTSRGRHHVHLSASVESAEQVGRRRGKPLVLEVRSGAMAEAGAVFFLTPNGVWLTARVDPSYIVFPRE